MTTRVLGVGNTLRGDDGIGPAVIEALRCRQLPGNIEAIDCGQAGLSLISLAEGADRLVVIDAVDMGQAPGAFRVFGLEDVLVSGDLPGGSFHDARLGYALRMADALGCLPRDVTIVGIQPADTGWRIGLGEEVSSVFPAVMSALMEILGMDGSLLTVSEHESEHMEE